MARISISREGIEVYRFSWLAAILAPLIALLLQTSVPLRLPFFTIFDLPLLVTIFFAVSRRNKIAGTLTGCIIGLAQDSFTHQPLGIFGISKTIVGYAASSIGIKVDVENLQSRLLLTFGFYLLHSSIRQLVGNLAQLSLPPWRWGHELSAALSNALLAVVIYSLLDRFKQRK